MAEAKSKCWTQEKFATKDSTLSSLRECDKQIIAFRLLIRNKMRELNQFEQHVKKREENKAALLALQPQLQENILQMAKTISTSDTDCLRIKNKLPYLSRQAIADNISRLELQLRSHNYRPREEELVLKEISKLRSSLPLVEVYRERLQGNRALRNNKMRLVNQRNFNFERLQKMHATLVADTDRLDQSRKLMEENEKGLDEVLKRKDALIEVAKEKLKKRQKRRQQKKIQEQSRPADSEAAVTVALQALKQCAPPVERNAFSLELTACRFLLRYARSLVGTQYGDMSAPAGTAAENLITCTATSTNKRTVSCNAEEKTAMMGRDMAASPACEIDDVAADSERDAYDPDRTMVHALVSARSGETIALAESVSSNGDEGGKFYSKHKEQDIYFVQVKPKNRSHKDRKAKKTIGHPPEIVANFLELGITVPRTLGDVPAAVSSIEQKLNYFELLTEQVYFEKVMAQRKTKDSASSDGNSGFSRDASKSTLGTQQGITIKNLDLIPLTFSSLGVLADATCDEQLDFRERDGLDFPTMAGSKSVLDGNSHVLLPDNFCPVADLDCKDSLELSLLSPLQAERKSYCEATKCSLEPVLSLPHLALFNLPEDQITISPQIVQSISSIESSFDKSDFLITSLASIERPQCVSPAGGVSCSISCLATSTSATLPVLAATAHQSSPTSPASVASPRASSVAVSLKCPASATSIGSVENVGDYLRAEPWLNLATEKFVSEENLSVSYATDGSLKDCIANIHRNSDGDGNGTCCTSFYPSVSTVVNEAQPGNGADGNGTCCTSFYPSVSTVVNEAQPGNGADGNGTCCTSFYPSVSTVVNEAQPGNGADGNGTCCTSFYPSVSTVVNGAQPGNGADPAKSNSNDGEANNGSDIHNNNIHSNFSATTFAVLDQEDDTVTVVTVAVKYSETPRSDDVSDDKSGVCHDEEPSLPSVSEAISLLEDTSGSRLDVVGEGYALVSSSISIASSDSGVAAVSVRHEPDCDPAFSTDSSKSTSSGCSCSCSNANDDGSDWSNSDVVGLDRCSDSILQPISHEDVVTSSTTSSLIRTASALSSISSSPLPQTTYATFCASLPSYTDFLQQVNCTSVTTSFACSVASHSNLQMKFQNTQSCSTVSPLQDCPSNDFLDQSVRLIPTIEISEIVGTIEDNQLSSIIDDEPSSGAIDRLASSSRDYGKRETDSGDVESYIPRSEISHIFKSRAAMQHEISSAPSSKNTCEQLPTTKLQTFSTSTRLKSYRSDTSTTSLNRKGLATASLSSARQSALLQAPTSLITIGEQCPPTIPVSASSSTLQDKQTLMVFPASPSPVGTSPSAGFCALSPAHVSAARSRQEASLVSYADIAKNSVPQKR